MLYEVVCDEFKQKRIEFFPGLNTVLGDEVGNNSIGKSTFLMIIDFVFGGQDYVLKSIDVQRNVGNHVIKFCFLFDRTYYYFSRETNHQEYVNFCDEHYTPLFTKNINEYLAFLTEKYKIDLPYLSFRGVVGRYIRVYGRDNIDEKHPLHSVSNEKTGEPVLALLKLFDLYKAIAELETLVKEKSDALNAFRKAQKLSFISKIGVRQYKANIKRLEELHNQEDQLTSTLDHNLMDMDSTITAEIIELKSRLSLLRRQRSKILSQLYTVRHNSDIKKYPLQDDFEMLLEFFPEANVKRFEEIERFHSEITDVLGEEFSAEERRLQALLNSADGNINELETKIQDITNTPNLSKTILEKHSELIKEIETLSRENERYYQKVEIADAAEIAETRASTMRTKQLDYLQNTLNPKMSEINDFIYEHRKKPPTISFHGSQYDFETRDDTGTGTSYKGLVVYDLSVLELTVLPILVHDSVVLKQIADEAIEKILEKYQSAGKQVFIALDKASSYTQTATDILNKTAVLHLSDNGNELFGRSWNEK